MKNIFPILITALVLSSCSGTMTKSISDTDKVFRDTLNSGIAYTFNYPQKYSFDWVENCIYIGRNNPDTSFSKTLPDWAICISYKGNLDSEREYLKTHHSDNLQRETSINEPVYCKMDKLQIGNYTADRYRFYTKRGNIYISENLIIDIGGDDYFSIDNQIQRETRSSADSIEFYKFIESFKITK
jgi:hypothetical protein